MNRRETLASLRRLFAIVWIVLMAVGVKLGLSTALEIRAGLLIAMALLSYLSAWGLLFALNPRKLDKLVIGCGIVTVSIALALAIVEVPALAGIIDYRVPFATPLPAWNRPGNRPDPELLFVREGGKTLSWRFQGNDLHRLKGVVDGKVYKNEIHLDADGFRNPTDDRRSEIVLIGDSFLEGPHTSEAKLISTALARKTGRSVANLGRSGYGPIQESIVLQRYALPRRPRSIVWAFYEGNDLADVREYPSARERLANRKPPTNAEMIYSRSFINNALEFAIRTWLRPEATRDPNLYLGHFESRGGEDVPFYFSSDDYNPASGPRAESHEFQQLIGLLETAEAVCRDHDAQLMVVFIPTKWRVYRAICGFKGRARALRWEIDDLPKSLETALKIRLGTVDYLDLTPEFERQAREGVVTYLPDDTHWSDEGHEIAAGRIADRLKAFLKDAPKTP